MSRILRYEPISTYKNAEFMERYSITGNFVCHVATLSFLFQILSNSGPLLPKGSLKVMFLKINVLFCDDNNAKQESLDK